MAIIKLAEGRYALRWRDAKRKRHYKTLDPMSYEEVKREHAKRILDRNQEKASEATVAQLCQLYLEQHDAYAKRPFSYRGRIRAKEIVANISADPLGEVAPAQMSPAKFIARVLGWRQRRSQTVSAGTLDREYNALRAAMTLAVRMGELDVNPLPRGAVPQLTSSTDSTPIYFQPEEWRAFYSALDDEQAWRVYTERVRLFGPTKIGSTIDTPRRYGSSRRGDSEATKDYRLRLLEFKPLWLALLHTGSRLSEIRLLTWEQVDLRNGFITIHMGKSARAKVLPIEADLRADLEARPRGIGGAFVYAKSDGSAYSEKAVQDAFHVYRKVAGLPDNLTVHKLRHTAGSWMAIAGRPVTEIQKVLGHATLAMTMKYVHLAPVHLKGAVTAIESMATMVEPAGHIVGHATASERENGVNGTTNEADGSTG